MSEWQPIETAPKDGTAIWILIDNRPYIGYCEPAKPPLRRADTWFAKASFRRREAETTDQIFGCYGIDVMPSHWMPLPEPPK